MNTAGEKKPLDGAPSPEHLKGIELSTQFENMDDATKRAIFVDVVRAFHYAASGGLTEEELAARKELYEELLSETEQDLDKVRNPRVDDIDRGDDR